MPLVRSIARHASLLAFAWLAVPSLDAAPGKLTSIGPFEFSGVVQQLVYPGRDPQRILVLSRENLFETRDGGANWRSALQHQPAIAPEKLIVDPSDAEHWWVVGISASRRQVIETRDGGRSWSTLARPAGSWPESYLVAFFVDAAAPQVLVAEYQERLAGYEYFVSTNGGATWSQRNPPGDAGRLLGVRNDVGWTRGYRVDFRSGTWTAHLDPPFGRHPMRTATDLVFDRARRDTFFIETSNGIAVTKDGGATFGPAVPGNLDGFSQSPVHPSHVAWTWGQLMLSLDRGTTAIRQEELPYAFRTAFDPATGEVVFSSLDVIYRRRLDGSLADPLPENGMNLFRPSQITVAGGKTFLVDDFARLHVLDEERSWRQRGVVSARQGTGFENCYGPSTLAVSPSDSRKMVMACGLTGDVFVSSDGGRSWRFSPAREPGVDPTSYDYEPILAVARGGAGDVLYLLRRSDIERSDREVGNIVFRSTDFGATWESLGAGFLEMVVHPDSSRGLIAVRKDGRLMRFRPAVGWQEVATAADQLFLPEWDLLCDLGFGYDPAHPELVYSIHHHGTFRSTDFGNTWELVAGFDDAFEAAGIDPYRLRHIARMVVDPFDPDHFLIPGQRIATRDGGSTFHFTNEADDYAASFDSEVPGRFLKGSLASGVFEITAALPPCPATPAAWCAGGGRFLLTVDWKDPQGNEGKATRVATGSDDSGLFYFFDGNNWELLVKVLDGCSLNQRFWVLAAGTTDVAYVMKVEDRWTGQIRHYANAAGRAAPAVIDTDAFSGCGTAPPPGAAARPATVSAAGGPNPAGGETSLRLAGNRFEVKTRWTDFAGNQGDGLTAPLASDNSGLFYFFSPNNWEKLVKVLDACAINGHYWVLAAATTDVGYRLEVRDTESNRTKTYTNPVGRAAPAQIDLQAFSCQ